jgi:anti-repressor protein
MNELIKIEYKYGEALVAGRELHDFLEVGTRYDNWMNRMIEYGFAENVDFVVTSIFGHNSKGGKQNKIDHLLKVNMAKEIAMIQRNDKGKQARQYFLQVEAYWNSPEMIMKRALEFANQRVAQLQHQNFLLLKENEEQKPKVEAYEQFLNSDGLITIADLAKIFEVQIKQLRKFMMFLKMIHRHNGYVPSEGNYKDCFKLIPKTLPNSKIVNVTLVKPEGVDRIKKKLMKEKFI